MEGEGRQRMRSLGKRLFKRGATSSVETEEGH